MKFYLSSYRLGNEVERLKELVSQTSGIFAYVPNALDFTTADPERRKARIEHDTQDLTQYGARVEVLDLKDYFGKKDALNDKIASLGGVYVCGGNTFVLRQAMKLSGFDEIILESQSRDDFLYIGYSAGVCALTHDMHIYAETDDPNDFPYPSITQQIWEGLGLLNFVFEPHYRSDHPESASTEKEVQYLIDNKILFKAYRDGEVLIMD